MRDLMIIAAGLALLVAQPLPALALSVEQVLALKKAGVGEKTIRALMEAEDAAQARGHGGSYVIRPFGGREWIVYESSTARGVEEYPLDLDPARADLKGVGRVLRARSASGARPAPGEGQPSRQPAGRQGYTLLLASLAERPPAERQVKDLVSRGLLARLLPVDEPGQGRRYLVLAGAFPDQAEAQAEGTRLRQEGKIGDYQVISQ